MIQNVDLVSVLKIKGGAQRPRLSMCDNFSYSGINNYLHTFVASTSQFAHTRLHKLEVCATTQSCGLGLTNQKCAYIFEFYYKYYKKQILTFFNVEVCCQRFINTILRFFKVCNTVFIQLCLRSLQDVLQTIIDLR